ncbi:hypothetical protein [Aeoliella sp. SH292]|uniref:hypothetical protein n=1 Tax=Aeoliella sp. SH292 TaxID=3454464 RepID=UPI003F959B97
MGLCGRVDLVYGTVAQTQATTNYFHSHRFMFYDSEPSTLTGAQGTYEGLENVTLHIGWQWA